MKKENYYTAVENNILSVFEYGNDKAVKEYDLTNEVEYRNAFDDGWIEVECKDGYYHVCEGFDCDDEVPNFKDLFVNEYLVEEYVNEQLPFLNEDGVKSIVDSLIFKMTEKCMNVEDSLKEFINCGAIEHLDLYDDEDDMKKQIAMSY